MTLTPCFEFSEVLVLLEGSPWESASQGNGSQVTFQNLDLSGPADPQSAPVHSTASAQAWPI